MIKISHVEKTYNTPSGPVKALKDINLHIEKGDIYGIIGLSGAGKSTLVRCINMLERPTSGSVLVDGKELTTMGDAELRKARKNIGMIFQHFNLLSSATVYDNVAFPLNLVGTDKEEIKKRVTELLDLVALGDKADKYPAQLSGGQKQRVGIARALASNPKILLCDEATSALDPQTTQSILELIKDINEKLKLTVVVITHEMQVIKDICDKVAVIENGYISENGTVIDVFTNPQKKITKDFISVLMAHDITKDGYDPDMKDEWFDDCIMLVTITFIGENATNPLISTIARKFDLEIGIVAGNIERIKNTPYGRLTVGIHGNKESTEQAINFLQTQDTKVEVIGYARRDDPFIN